MKRLDKEQFSFFRQFCSNNLLLKFPVQVMYLRSKQDGKLEHDGEEISTGEPSTSDRKRKRKKSEEGEISDDADDVNPKDMVIYSF